MATLTNPATISLGTTLLDRIGNTPLIRLERLTARLPGIQILGKAEWANPGGSVKDRAASAIVADAQVRGLLGASRTTRGQRLLDANKTRIDQVTTGDRAPGRRTWAYGRAGRPCRRCGTSIRRAEQGVTGEERARFWCPACMPEIGPGLRPRPR